MSDVVLFSHVVRLFKFRKTPELSFGEERVGFSSRSIHEALVVTAEIVRAQFSPCAFVNLVFRYFVFVPAIVEDSIITSNRSDTQRFDVCKMFLRIKCLSG